MAQESQLAHRVLTSLALPYITNVSPTMTDPHFIAGSSDILTSINGYAERRPGFSATVETTPTTFNNLQRLFTWDRFDGTFYIMACDINASNFAVVYKLQVGVDASFVSIFTEPTATGSAYDFVNSNNTLYFSNGFYVRKWDPVNGVTRWGIAPYAATTVLTQNPTTGLTTVSGGYSGTAWTNPSLAAGGGTPPYATNGPNTIGAGYSQMLELGSPGFNSIPAGNTIQSISIALTQLFTTTTNLGALCTMFLLQNNVPVASTAATFFATPTVQTLNINMNIASAGFSPSNVTDTSGFGVGIAVTAVNQGLGTSGTITMTVRTASISIQSSGGPVVTFTGTGLTATTGYQYVVCYGNSNSGHVGSPCPPSNLVKPTNQSMSIPVVASTDPQVNQIRIFRTTDSATGFGGQAYFEIPNSPVPNTSTSITDSATDISLNLFSISPTPTFNDPPSFVPGGGLKGLVYFAGRIWGFTNTAGNGNQVWFTGNEEITIGVPEECIPSGIAGNYWGFDEPVQALQVSGIGTNQGLTIFSGGRVYAVQGNTLDTFVRFQVSNRRGCRNRTSVDALGGMLAWYDSANQVWATNGSSVNELSTLIRNDLAGVNQSSVSITFHTSNRFNWLVVSTGTKIYVYDVDQDQWMPPWTFAAKYIHSGEISPGNYVLMASNGTTALQLNTAGTAGSFNDNGSTYQPILKFGLLSVVPDYGSRFSYIGVGSYNEPTRTGYPSTFQVTNNGQSIADFLICHDDDPTLATYTSIAAGLVDTAMAFNRQNGNNMKQLVYQTIQPAARWIGMQIKLAKADQADNLYEVFMGYKGLGGR